jgi:hypothetical protein
MNAVELHYSQSETAYHMAAPHNGAVALLCGLNDGAKTQGERQKCLEAGEYREEDLKRDDI